MKMLLDVKAGGTITLGEGKTISIEIEPIFWASGTTTYHIYVNCPGDYAIDNPDDGHLIITDNF